MNKYSTVIKHEHKQENVTPFPFYKNMLNFSSWSCYRGQPKAGTGYKMLFVPFVFSMSRFHGPSFRCNRIVVIVTLIEAIEGIPDSTKTILIFEGTKTSTIFTRLLHERKLKSGYLERRIYERPLHLRVSLLYREWKRTYFKTIFTSISCKT